MKYKAVIFDMDGTLLDTLKGITDSVNLAFEQLGYSVRHDYKTAKHFIGAGALEFVRRAMKGMDITDKQAQEIGEHFLDNYLHLQGPLSVPFPGIIDLLNDLKKSGYYVCIASNKPQHLLDNVVLDKFPDFKFDAVLGQRNGIPEKPNPYVIEEIEHLFNITNNDCLYIGDSEYDYLTAKNANIDCMIVKYGYGFYDEPFMNNVTYSVNDVDDIRKILLK